MSRFQRRGFLSIAGLAGLGGVAQAMPLGAPHSGKENGRKSAGTAPGLSKAHAPPVQQNPHGAAIPDFVASLNRAEMHKVDGGWARELNHAQFHALKDLAVVNMGLEVGCMREMFWRQQAEWGYVVSGKCRIMSLDEQGRSSVDDVGAGDIWSVPAGTPHSIIGLAPTGAEILMFLDDADGSEFHTNSISAWMAATPPELLEKNFNTPQQVFIASKKEPRWISRLSKPGDLDTARKNARIRPGAEKIVYLFSRSNFYARAAGGYMQVVDPTSFPASRPFSAASDVIHVNGMREMHWHPHAAEFGIVLSGTAELTVMCTDGHQKTARLDKNDVWNIPRGQGHCIVNRGAEDLHVLTVYKADRYAGYGLSDWLTHVPVEVTAETLGLPVDVIDHFPMARKGFMPR
ncbi:cupin domain-containing protein [Candidatus Kirkpatrickella diaphorinae]|uniref:Cupin domain-containing protein n=1 Tax=Candidatus Kirkpatrickella diaphorinae TaxID=2984322 RepID=A0ABY6GGQ0_9PROT|nr:cupin domain-containing protein [Candidatus Kirkpatrickella diaphorinae]UYH50689.1 cupin domain-containing protein [Candidatus Kirkpatrickella diaphorinae]